LFELPHQLGMAQRDRNLVGKREQELDVFLDEARACQPIVEVEGAHHGAPSANGCAQHRLELHCVHGWLAREARVALRIDREHRLAEAYHLLGYRAAPLPCALRRPGAVELMGSRDLEAALAGEQDEA